MRYLEWKSKSSTITANLPIHATHSKCETFRKVLCAGSSYNSVSIPNVVACEPRLVVYATEVRITCAVIVFNIREPLDALSPKVRVSIIEPHYSSTVWFNHFHSHTPWLGLRSQDRFRSARCKRTDRASMVL